MDSSKARRVSEPRPLIDYGTDGPRRWQSVATARVVVVLIGIALPYLARVPGALSGRPDWLTSYFSQGFSAFALLMALNAITWVAILFATFAMRTIPAICVAATVGFALPAYGHAKLDLGSNDSAVVAWLLIPVYSLPLVGLGGLLGLFVDGVSRRKLAHASATKDHSIG